MGLDTAYVKYSVSLILTLAAVTSLNFLDFSRPLTFSVVLFAPLLFGYTAYISRDSFQKASLLAAASLPFATLGVTFAAFALIATVTNILVSFFASGKSFRSFYGSTSLPLLGSGFLASILIFSMVMTQPGLAQEVENSTAEALGSQTEQVIEQSNILQMQRDTRVNMIKSVGKASVGLTQAYVLNETRGNLTPEGQAAVMSAFNSARNEVPEKLGEKANRSIGLDSVDFSEKSEKIVKRLFMKEMFFLAIPVVTFGIYGLQPIIGILTALAGVFFRELDGYLSGTGE